MTEWTFSSFTGGQENMVTACINKEKEAARHKKDLFPGHRVAWVMTRVTHKSKFI